MHRHQSPINYLISLFFSASTMGTMGTKVRGKGQGNVSEEGLGGGVLG
jgi:hypothetical protein